MDDKNVIYTFYKGVIFPNDDSKTAKGISLNALKKKLGYDLVP